MLTIEHEDMEKLNGQIVYRVQGKCLSSDTKPTNVANGSMLLEMDTGKVLMFDADGEAWLEFGG